MKIRLLLILSCLLFSFGCNKKQEVYRIGIDSSWYPLELAGQEGYLMAFAIDLLVEVAKKEKLQLSVLPLSWDNLFQALREERVDAVLSSLQPYSFNIKEYTFSEPFLHTGPILVVPKDSPHTKIDELENKEIAIVQNSNAGVLLQKYPKISIKSYESIPHALSAVTHELSDAAALSLLITQNYVRDLFSNELKMVNTPLNDEGVRLITLYKKKPNLVRQFNQGIKTLQKGGHYHTLLEKWGLSPNNKPPQDLNKKIADFLKPYKPNREVVDLKIP